MSHNICATWNCNDYFCGGRDAIKRTYFTVDETTDVQNVHQLIGVARMWQRCPGRLFLSVHHWYQCRRGRAISFGTDAFVVCNVNRNPALGGADQLEARLTQLCKSRVCTLILLHTDISYWPAAAYGMALKGLVNVVHMTRWGPVNCIFSICCAKR